jgi:hypothetical protein
MKSNRNGGAAVVEANQVDTAPTTTATQNFTVHKYHITPGGERTCYRIPGVQGNLVVFNNLFEDGVAPPELILTVPLKAPQVKLDKEAEKLAKMQEKAAKAEERLKAQQAKAEEKKRKMEEALENARRRAGEAASATADSAENAS